MRRFFMVIVLIGLFSGLNCFPINGEEIRSAQVAGMFYPDSGPVLRDKVDGYLEETKGFPVLGRVLALIVPHAGYEYSGKVAAYAYKEILGRKFDTIVLIGPSHHQYFRGISVYGEGAFETPLGKIPIDEELASSIIKQNETITFNPKFHLKEHSLEVQLPFLQRTGKDFKIVPILMGDQSKLFCNILSQALIKVLKDKKRVLIIASSNFSRYRTYSQAVKKDKYALSIIKKMDEEKLIKGLAKDRDEKGKVEMCGGGPVAVAIKVAKALGADKVEILNYANSGDVAGNRHRVVGYASAILYATDQLDKDAQRELLKIARSSIKGYLQTESPPSFKPISPLIKENRGAFVTLTKNGRLRGCTGYIHPIKPLYETVRDAAIKAAMKDLRFPPLAKRELGRVKMEISVLSPLEEIQDINFIQPGVHGLYITQGWQAGLLLPQVAKEHKWGRERFLKETCLKAGLPADAYKKGAKIHIFTAQVFGED